MYVKAEPESNNIDKYDELRLHWEKILSCSITDLDIPMRIAIPLDENLGVRRIGDLLKLKREDLLKVKRIGPKSVDDLEKILHRFGYSLGMTIPK